MNQKIDKNLFLEMIDYAHNCQLKIIPIYEYLYNLCANFNIQYTLCEGSLLGCIKYQNIVPWDDDIDIYMNTTNFDKLCNLLIDNTSFRLEKQYEHLYYFRNISNNLKIDIFTYGFRNSLYECKNLIETKFINNNIKIPDNYKKILNTIYDNDWEYMCYISNHKWSKENLNSNVGFRLSLKPKYFCLTNDEVTEYLYDKK